MKFAIHSNRRDIMNAVNAMSMSNQSAFNAPLRNSIQIKLKLNTKINTIKEFYEMKEQKTSEVIS